MTNKSNIKINICKYFRRKSGLAYLPQALQVSANLIQETPFCSKLKFSAEKLKETALARYFIKVQ